MKRNLLFALAAIVLFTACSNDEDEKIKNEENVQIGIKFDPSIVATKTRAHDDREGETGQDRVKIDKNSTIYIYFFDGSDKVVGEEISGNFAELTSETGMVCTGENITTNIQKVILVANVPNDLFGKDAIKTYEDLKKAYVTVKELNDMYNTEGQNFWLVAEGTISNWTTGEEGKKEASVTLTPHPIFSRIDVTVNLTSATNGLFQGDGHSNKVVDLKSVDLLYGGSHGNFTSLTPTEAELKEHLTLSEVLLAFGIIPDPIGNNSYWDSWKFHPNYQKGEQLVNTEDIEKDSFEETIMHGNFGAPNVEDPEESGKEFTKSFYLFPNPSDMNKSVILTIYGERYSEENKQGTKKPVFWPVHLDGSTDPFRPKIEQGNIYTVTLSLNGDYYTNTDLGEETPEVTAPANITIKVTAVQWKTVVELGTIEFD